MTEPNPEKRAKAMPRPADLKEQLDRCFYAFDCAYNNDANVAAIKATAARLRDSAMALAAAPDDQFEPVVSLASLPEEIIVHIMKYLGPRHLARLAATCHTLRQKMHNRASFESALNWHITYQKYMEWRQISDMHHCVFRSSRCFLHAVRPYWTEPDPWQSEPRLRQTCEQWAAVDFFAFRFTAPFNLKKAKKAIMTTCAMESSCDPGDVTSAERFPNLRSLFMHHGCCPNLLTWMVTPSLTHLSLDPVVTTNPFRVLGLVPNLQTLDFTYTGQDPLDLAMYTLPHLRRMTMFLDTKPSLSSISIVSLPTTARCLDTVQITCFVPPPSFAFLEKLSCKQITIKRPLPETGRNYLRSRSGPLVSVFPPLLQHVGQQTKTVVLVRIALPIELAGAVSNEVPSLGAVSNEGPSFGAIFSRSAGACIMSQAPSPRRRRKSQTPRHRPV